jgi:hypothetical protein
LNSALNPNIVQSIRAAERQRHATLQKSSWYSDHLAAIRAFLAARRGPREIEHDLERLPVAVRAGYILLATAVTWSNGGVCCSHTRDWRGDCPPPAQLLPEDARTGENNARYSTVQNESLPPPRPESDFKPIEIPKTVAAGAEMIDPWINLRNRNLMARHALQKL